jgi:hypothetical protein
MRESLAIRQPEIPRPTRLQPQLTPATPPVIFQFFLTFRHQTHPPPTAPMVRPSIQIQPYRPLKKKKNQKEKPPQKNLSNASFQSQTKKKKERKNPLPTPFLSPATPIQRSSRITNEGCKFHFSLSFFVHS